MPQTSLHSLQGIPILATNKGEEAAHSVNPAFAHDSECCSKLRLWCARGKLWSGVDRTLRRVGELWRIKVDGVVSAGNEDFGYRSGTQVFVGCVETLCAHLLPSDRRQQGCGGMQDQS